MASRVGALLRAECAAVKAALAGCGLASVEEYVSGKTAVLQKVLTASGMTAHELEAVASMNA